MWVLLIVASVGFKVPDNLYSFGNRGSQLPYYGMKSQSGYFLISQTDTGYTKEKKNEIYWIITEPLGGVIGCFLGGFAGCGVGWILTSEFQTEEQLVLEWILGGGIGIPLGIWVIGKYIEREKGSFRHALFGSLAITVPSIIFFKVWGVIANEPSYYWALATAYPIVGSLSVIGGMIGYRLSLKKEKNEKNR